MLDSLIPPKTSLFFFFFCPSNVKLHPGPGDDVSSIVCGLKCGFFFFFFLLNHCFLARKRNPQETVDRWRRSTGGTRRRQHIQTAKDGVGVIPPESGSAFLSKTSEI